jgi:hypothetical protein
MSCPVPNVTGAAAGLLDRAVRGPSCAICLTRSHPASRLCRPKFPVLPRYGYAGMSSAAAAPSSRATRYDKGVLHRLAYDEGNDRPLVRKEGREKILGASPRAQREALIVAAGYW